MVDNKTLTETQWVEYLDERGRSGAYVGLKMMDTDSLHAGEKLYQYCLEREEPRPDYMTKFLTCCEKVPPIYQYFLFFMCLDLCDEPPMIRQKVKGGKHHLFNLEYIQKQRGAFYGAETMDQATEFLFKQHPDILVICEDKLHGLLEPEEKYSFITEESLYFSFCYYYYMMQRTYHLDDLKPIYCLEELLNRHFKLDLDLEIDAVKISETLTCKERSVKHLRDFIQKKHYFHGVDYERQYMILRLLRGEVRNWPESRSKTKISQAIKFGINKLLLYKRNS